MIERPELLLSIHLPKTAGLTLWSVLKDWYPEQERMVVHEGTGQGDVYSLSSERKREIRLVHGHFTFGTHTEFSQEAKYLCFLRNPIERFISLYYFILASRNHPLHRMLVDSGMSLLDFARSGLSPELDNCQTRMLSGRPQVHFVKGTERCSSVDLARAKRHIDEHFCFVGLAESFNQGLLLLGQMMGRQVPRVEHKNVTKGRVSALDIDQLTISAIECVSGYDMELYDFGKRHYELIWRQTGVLRRLALSMRKVGLRK